MDSIGCVRSSVKVSVSFIQSESNGFIFYVDVIKSNGSFVDEFARSVVAISNVAFSSFFFPEGCKSIPFPENRSNTNVGLHFILPFFGSGRFHNSSALSLVFRSFVCFAYFSYSRFVFVTNAFENAVAHVRREPETQ